jgi:hypothetical protein
MPTDKPPLRISIMLNSLRIPKWTYLLLEEIIQSGDAEIALIVLSDLCREKKPLLRRSMDRCRGMTLALWKGIETRLLRVRNDASASVSADELLSNITKITSQHPNGAFDGPALQAARQQAIDIHLQLGDGTGKNHALDAARFGTWVCHYANYETHRSSPMGVWEVITKTPTTGSALLMFDETSDDPTVLATSQWATCREGINRNISACCWQVSALILRTVKKLHAMGTDMFMDEVAENNAPPLFLSQSVRSTPGK